MTNQRGSEEEEIKYKSTPNSSNKINQTIEGETYPEGKQGRDTRRKQKIKSMEEWKNE